MINFKRKFIDFLIENDVLTFGDFTTKSERKTPYFVNMGRLQTGVQIAWLGRYYAHAIATHAGAFDVLFGPAYKGIPIAVSTAIALHEHHHQNVSFCFNRKEVKDHGEGGVLIGHHFRDGDNVLIVEDVVTAGTSVREMVPILRAAADVKLTGLVVAVDRMERGTGQQTALAELGAKYSMPTFAIVTIKEILTHLYALEAHGHGVVGEPMLLRMQDYLAKYGGVQ